MNVVVAMDSFKGCMNSLEAGLAVKKGIERACRSGGDSYSANVIVSPLADGGEGTVEALVSGMKGDMKTSYVRGPLGKRVEAIWGVIENDGVKTAIIEMASAAGISLLDKSEFNPLYTTTYGVGELIKEAIADGCRKFIIGIGGSATNDGGVGMLSALGYDFIDASGNKITDGAIGLKNLEKISSTNRITQLDECRFVIACDVTNPLCGDNGCSAVFGPQKGATPEMVKEMDAWLEKFAKISGGNPDYPGAGAAGGLGFAFLTYTNATLESGIDIVIKETGLEEKIRNADVVVTGEGRLDAQSVMGKAPIGIAKLAKKYGKKVIAFCGSVSDDARICNEYGIDGYFSIINNIVTDSEAMDKENALRNLDATAEQVFRVIG